MIKKIVFVLMFVSFPVLAADGETTEYFGALWDFIDWIYEALDKFTQTIMDYLSELAKVIILWYFEWKLDTVKFIWSYVEPIIDSLNLTDVITQAFGGLSSDLQLLITKLRIGEGLNLLLSAHVTRSLLRFMGW